MKAFLTYMFIFLAAIGLTSCELVGGIFKGGMWTGVILVLGVIAVVIWALSRAFGGGNRS